MKVFLCNLPVKNRSFFPNEWFSPNAVGAMIVEILVEAIENSLLMDVCAVPEEADPHLVSFFIVIIFGEGELSHFDYLILVMEKEARLKHQ
jgi:hypothetical protein